MRWLDFHEQWTCSPIRRQKKCQDGNTDLCKLRTVAEIAGASSKRRFSRAVQKVHQNPPDSDKDTGSEMTRFAENTSVSLGQWHILDHTLNRAAGGLYCGDSPAMQSLVNAGFMEFAGRKAFVPDSYFRVTASGREAWKSNQPPEVPVPKLSVKKRRARERYSLFLRADSHLSFGDWLKQNHSK